MPKRLLGSTPKEVAMSIGCIAREKSASETARATINIWVDLNLRLRITMTMITRKLATTETKTEQDIVSA